LYRGPRWVLWTSPSKPEAICTLCQKGANCLDNCRHLCPPPLSPVHNCCACGITSKTDYWTPSRALMKQMPQAGIR
jgi:hypothetical protein